MHVMMQKPIILHIFFNNSGSTDFYTLHQQCHECAECRKGCTAVVGLLSTVNIIWSYNVG